MANAVTATSSERLFKGASSLTSGRPGWGVRRRRRQIVQGAKAHRVAGLDRGATEMRQEKAVGQVAVAGMDIGLASEHVQARGEQPPGAQGGDQRLVVDQRATGRVDQDCPGGRRARVRSLIRCWVAAPPGQFSDRKWQCGSRSSSVG